jgi:O-antigen/teichoic acid export membrane protein
MLCLVIFNSEVLSLFGLEFKSAGWILIILVFAFFIEIIPGQLKQLFQMSSKQNMELANSLGMIAVNILLNILLIPRFGMTGAAFALLLTFAFVSIVRLVETSRFYHFSPFTLRYVKVLVYIFCSLFISVNYLLKMDLIYRILFAALILAGFSFLSYKFKSSEDILIWKAIKRRLYIKQGAIIK